jgi:hypothetical protein
VARKLEAPRDGSESVGLIFDDLARADADGDGRLSIEELARATAPGVDPNAAPTLLDVLSTRGITCS